MKHEEENRKKEIEVKRKEAFEEFENRVKEKQRKERESRLKQLHHFEVMKRQEEEDRKLHIQYLMQKKATPTGASVNSSMQQGGIKKSQLLKRKQVSN
jgi:glutathionylspermidine synthase